jgi:3-demethoxyubiquinol 3-hydroxylase
LCIADPASLRIPAFLARGKSMSLRRTQGTDRWLALAESALLGTSGEGRGSQERPTPASDLADVALETRERLDVAGMMRVNHTGEVCAQALYLGQAAVARDEATRQHLLRAADEELDHLKWCQKRLDELASRPSLLNPLWYAGSFAIGAGAALFGDRVSLGFVVETERQVETHLGEHLERLPHRDQRSRAILQTMQREEAEHGDAARERGGMELPDPVKRMMAFSAGVMKAIAYRI